MTNRTVEHPDREVLRAYGQGLLSPDSTVILEEHLAQCEGCCDLLDQVPGDSFLDRLRDADSVITVDPGEDTDTDGSGMAAAIPLELINHPRYRVLGLVGQGGMGAVYRAEHRRMERTVALKVINPGLMRHPTAVQRFEQEARAAARLDHANIVRAYDADQAGGLHFLVMEYVEGTGLADVVGERGSLPIAEACDHARQAALGLQHAHERGMVHRDIKPHNLMLLPDGLVKVLDFGLARLPRSADGPLAEIGPKGTLTGAGAVMGTADYIAPEQAADPRSADIRADIYSLGCTLFHLLTGRPPFPEGTVTEKLAQHVRGAFPSLTDLRPEVPPGLAGVVARMMATDPQQRYATPGEVAQALGRFCPPASRPPGTRKRHAWIAGLVLLSVPLFAAVVLLCLPTTRTDQPPTPDNVPQPEPRAEAPPPLSDEEAENLAEQAILRLGGQVSFNVPHPGTRSAAFVNLGRLPLTDADLQPVASFKRLRGLDLSNTPVTDAALAHVARLTRMTVLNLPRTRVRGPGLKHLAGLKELRLLDLDFSKVGDEGLQHLVGLPDLERLGLHSTRITDAGLVSIGQIRSLLQLRLSNTAITGQGLKHLTGLSRLTTLSLINARNVDDEGMKAVGQLRALESLELLGTRVTDKGLQHLAGLRKLSSLQLMLLKVTDSGLAVLEELPALQDLDLSHTGITDQGLKLLARHQRLRRLSLQHLSQVSDDGLKTLAALKGLEYLLLGGTPITDAGFRELARLPNLKVLGLGHTRITDASLQELARMQTLVNVDLTGASKVTAAGVGKLRKARPELRVTY
jgi:serine/threonine protein kinase/Leucine-rich repeat (LRR) protein